MNKYQKAFIDRPGHYLMHYNHNHDKLGRFARSIGGGNSNTQSSKDIYKNFRKADGRNLTKQQQAILDDVLSDPKVIRAKNKVDKELKPLDDYLRNPNTRDKYAAIAGYYSAKGWNALSSQEERIGHRWFYVYEDGDQGESTSSANFYLLDKGYDLNKFSDNVIKANNEYESTLKDTISSKTGEYGNKEVKTVYGGKSDLNTSIMDAFDYYNRSYGYDTDRTTPLDARYTIGEVSSSGKSSDNAKIKFMNEEYPKILEEDYQYELKNNVRTEEDKRKLDREYKIYGRKRR